MVDRANLDYRRVKGIRESANFRLLLISLLAALVGVAAGIVAFLLLILIGLVTELFVFQRINFEMGILQRNTLGAWVILITPGGGLIVGLMARDGCPKIR